MKSCGWTSVVALALAALAVACVDLDPLPDRPDAATDADADSDADSDADADADADGDSDADSDTDTNADAGADGACTNEPDLEIFDSTDLVAAMTNCLPGCIYGDLAVCVAVCVAEDTGLSAECSACFGDTAWCGATNCMYDCGEPMSEGCLTCIAESCGSAFETCAGVPLPIS